MRTMALAMRTGISFPDFLENDLIFVLHFAPQDGACNSSVGHHRNLIEAEPCDREHTEVRRSIFLRGRRAFVKAGKYVEKGKAIPLDLAYRCIAYYGWFKHSDSEYFREKYNVDKIFEKAKRRVSRESKIYRKAGSCNLEYAA